MRRNNGNETIENPTEMPTGVSRRAFLQLGTGLFIFFVTDATAAFQEPSRLPDRPGYPAISTPIYASAATAG